MLIIDLIKAERITSATRQFGRMTIIQGFLFEIYSVWA